MLLYKPDNVTVGANYVYKGTIKGTNPTATYTALRNNTAANTPTGIDATNAANLIGFEFAPLTGLTFKPTTISFDCQKFGTGSGIIDVYWLSSNGTSTVIKAGIVPAREANAVSEGADTNTFTMDVSGISIPDLGGKSILAIYIHSLGSAKDVGLANISISGNLNGTVANVNQYTVASSVLPSVAGVVNSDSPATVDEGTVVKLTAVPNFGYSFLNWTDGSGTVVSTDNPYSVAVTANTTLNANFNTLTTYSLDVATLGGANNYMVNITPAGTMVNGKRMFVAGTNVVLTASNNPILNFSNWGTGETNSVYNVVMDANKAITAQYNLLDYIVGWDFYDDATTVDFSSNVVNNATSLILRNEAGVSTSGLNFSAVSNQLWYGKNCRINWQTLASKYYYQIKINAQDYTNLKVQAAMLSSYSGYPVQKCEYSLDGTNFTLIGTYDTSVLNTWNTKSFELPAAANNQAEVTIRWIADFTTTPVVNAKDSDGTSISEIYVFGTPSVFNDGVAPVLVSSVPTASANGASATGKVVLNFDERIKIGSAATATLNGKNLIPVVFGKSISFDYSGLEYNTTYTFDLAGNVVSDLADNTLTNSISISFTTLNKPAVAKKAYDFIVGIDGNFKAALLAADAAKNSGNRFYIFFPNGEYDLGTTTGDTTQQTTIGLPNISFIGQSTTGVTLFNSPTQLQEGINTTPTINFTAAANNIYMQDLTLLNKMDYRLGIAEKRAVALRHNGDKNIFKNVRLLSNQDTYFTGAGRTYWENGEIHGTVDYIFGDGDIFFNQCLLYMENRVGGGGGIVTAAATGSNWGYVFNNCTIDGDAQQNGIYGLGRSWNLAPKVAYINTTMKILPTVSAWGDPMNVVPYRFAEYNSLTADGVEVDLSQRRTQFTLGTNAFVNAPVLSKAEADLYTIENVLGGSDAWMPTLYTEQVAAPVVSNTGKTLNWDDNNYVLGWAIFKDNVFIAFTTTNSYDTTAQTSGLFTVRAANAMGGLGVASNVLDVTTLGVSANNLWSNDITVSPNPTSNIAVVQIGGNSQKTNLSLYNLLGVELWSNQVITGNNESVSIDLSAFANGVYLLKVNKEGTIRTVKIVKK